MARNTFRIVGPAWIADSVRYGNLLHGKTLPLGSRSFCWRGSGNDGGYCAGGIAAAVGGLLGGTLGGLLGMIAAALVTMVISRTVEPEPSKSFLELAVLAEFGYLGLMLGPEKAAQLRSGSPGSFDGVSAAR